MDNEASTRSVLNAITAKRLAILADTARAVMTAPRADDWRDQIEAIRAEIKSLEE